MGWHFDACEDVVKMVLKIKAGDGGTVLTVVEFERDEKFVQRQSLKTCLP